MMHTVPTDDPDILRPENRLTEEEACEQSNALEELPPSLRQKANTSFDPTRIVRIDYHGNVLDPEADKDSARHVYISYSTDESSLEQLQSETSSVLYPAEVVLTRGGHLKINDGNVYGALVPGEQGYKIVDGSELLADVTDDGYFTPSCVLENEEYLRSRIPDGTELRIGEFMLSLLTEEFPFDELAVYWEKYVEAYTLICDFVERHEACPQ